MSDLIDRQAAIDALKNDMASINHIIKGMSAYDVRLDVYVSQRNQVNCDIDTISNLPPAQPEPCEDAVSRKAVQYLLAHFVDEDKYVDACDGLKHLPPVTPKQPEQHIDADGTLWITVPDIERVTRVIVDEEKSKFCRQFYMEEEQRTGKWIPSDSQCGIRCSACGAPVDDFCHSIDYIDLVYEPNFCPNCGAKMKGVAE